jgi:uncharacterized phage infection (PIP) family protein YhgE
MARSFNKAKIRQAINRYNSAARQYNRNVQTAVNKYNSAVRQENQRRRQVVAEINRRINRYNAAAREHNARIRSNRSRLQNAISRYNQQARSFNSQRSAGVTSVTQSYELLDRNRSAHYESMGRADLVDLAEREAANTVDVAIAIDTDEGSQAAGDTLESTKLTDELSGISDDLDARWRGAIYSLSPNNPDATRHFCTSAREIVTTLIHLGAPTEEIIATYPNYERVRDTNKPTRRARINYILESRGILTQEFSEFIDKDVTDLLGLIDDLNSGTHGPAGKYPLAALRAMKTRVEDAIQFLTRVLSY